jgi:hypothetical protein
MTDRKLIHRNVLTRSRDSNTRLPLDSPYADPIQEAWRGRSRAMSGRDPEKIGRVRPCGEFLILNQVILLWHYRYVSFFAYECCDFSSELERCLLKKRDSLGKGRMEMWSANGQNKD